MYIFVFNPKHTSEQYTIGQFVYKSPYSSILITLEVDLSVFTRRYSGLKM